MSATDRKRLKQIYPDGFCWAWGLPAGASNDRKWGQLEPGTLVGFMVNGLQYVSSVTYKTHNPDLSLSLWEKHPTRDQAFEYVFFLTEPLAVNIPTSEINAILDYNLRGAPQGATRIADESARDLLIEALRDKGVSKIIAPANDGETDDLDIASTEGKAYYRKHRVYERDKKLRNAVLKNGTKCVCCGFHFETSFGPEFKGFAEVHHLLPVSTGIRKSKLSDFAVLCANCHRAAHHKTKIPRSIEELKSRLGLS